MGSFSSRCLTLSSFHCSRVESRKKRSDGKPSHTRPCSMAPCVNSSLCCSTLGSCGQDDCPACKGGERQPRACRGLGTAGVVPLSQATITPQHHRPHFHPAAQLDAADTEPSPTEEFAACVKCYFPRQCCRWSSKQLSKSGTSTSSELEAVLSQSPTSRGLCMVALNFPAIRPPCQNALISAAISAVMGIERGRTAAALVVPLVTRAGGISHHHVPLCL